MSVGLPDLLIFQDKLKTQIIVWIYFILKITVLAK